MTARTVRCQIFAWISLIEQAPHVLFVQACSCAIDLACFATVDVAFRDLRCFVSVTFEPLAQFVDDCYCCCAPSGVARAA